jgi:transposase
MDRDPHTKKKGYSSKIYMDALAKGLLPHYRRSQLFMQDNAGTHTSYVVRAFLLRHHINTIAWPPYSLDLNPIEHLWWHLKKGMFGHYPQYNYYSVAAEEWEGFCDAFKECWRSIRGKLIKVLIISMPRRIYACRRAQGWRARY